MSFLNQMRTLLLTDDNDGCANFYHLMYTERSIAGFMLQHCDCNCFSPLFIYNLLTLGYRVLIK
jgi:hypothetical protein